MWFSAVTTCCIWTKCYSHLCRSNQLTDTFYLTHLTAFIGTNKFRWNVFSLFQTFLQTGSERVALKQSKPTFFWMILTSESWTVSLLHVFYLHEVVERFWRWKEKNFCFLFLRQPCFSSPSFSESPFFRTVPLSLSPSPFHTKDIPPPSDIIISCSPPSSCHLHPSPTLSLWQRKKEQQI